MHKLLSTLALFAFAAILFAQSPFVGKWKLDTARTKHTIGDPPPKELTLVIEEQGDNLRMTVTGTGAQGSPISMNYTVPVKGGPGQMQEGPFDTISSKVINTNVREITFGKGEREVTVRHMVSQDGKTMGSMVKGVSPNGKPIEWTEVYEKQ